MATPNTYIEVRDEENILSWVLRGTEANAHLVATCALAQGIELTAEQYHISIGAVHGALAFYYDNKELIDTSYEDACLRAKQLAISGKAKLEQMRRRAEERND